VIGGAFASLPLLLPRRAGAIESISGKLHSLSGPESTLIASDAIDIVSVPLALAETRTDLIVN